MTMIDTDSGAIEAFGTQLVPSSAIRHRPVMKLGPVQLSYVLIKWKKQQHICPPGNVGLAALTAANS
ncbi:hypothetical protein M514_19937 [Trichuris suis]|uniref:Uncharacterized protein n=1 Tax=Trichuris suis TaxID=68888 RepID=A0A085NEF8_9BILA|nr:hypothetical protein M514_19937 [Trichuris suis]